MSLSRWITIRVLVLLGISAAWVATARAQTASDVQVRRDVMQQYSPRIQMKSAELLKNIEEKEVEVVQGEVKQRGRELVLQTKDKPVVVENTNQISPYAQRLPYNFELRRGETEMGVTARPTNLQAVDTWEQTALGEKYEKLDEAYAELDQRSERLAESSAGKQELIQFSDQLEKTRGRLIESYRQASDAGDEADLEALLDNFRDVQRAGKALYGLNRDDRYPPETYERIHFNSKGTVAILEQGQRVHCSGVLIGRDLVLTNEHCTRNVFPNALRVRFDYEENLLGDPLPSRTFEVVELPGFSLERGGLDFTVLRVSQDPDGNLPGDVYPVQCMTRVRVKRDDPLYLVGHPLGEPRTVHDNTFVYFPFSVTELEFTELEMLVRIEFQGADDETERLDEFRTSYQERTQAGFKFFENISTRWGGQPTIGVNSDTFHGNSGSAAFHRRTHRVVGILFDGEDDRDEEWEVGWRAHEAVLPITRVIAQLDHNDSAWRNEDGICIHD